jgi:hypothetical protein
VELCALLVLAAANAGRVAGLDAFVGILCDKYCPLQLFGRKKNAW